MDRGARFYRSDFQVHSPRDAQWTGQRPVTAADRMAYATAFVQHCRGKGIDAVAITDHHDICFIKYVQAAAQGIAAGDFDAQSFVPNPAVQTPIVFPGVELTLQVPCQAIVLLDAHAGIDMQQSLLNLLGLVPMHPELEERGPQVVRLRFKTLHQLDEALKHNPQMRGRYIILPNLNEGGQDTLLRNGFQHHYAEMPCVGGYTEKDFASFTPGHLNKLDGGDPNFGRRRVGLFQTSDSRREDCNLLGCRTTWVKFAEPTAEALRQACLSRESRLFQTTPSLPTRYISRVEVTASVYLGELEQELNPQFNALIGGRGTGKSTFLEYVRWTLQDQAVDPANDGGVDRKRQHFLDTLRDASGTVRVHWVIDGTLHVVSFTPGANGLTLQVGTDAPRPATAEEIRTLLPIRAYSQKQLSTVSGKRTELQRFVEEPIRERLRQFENQFEEQRAQIRSHHLNRRRRIDLQTQLHLHETKLASIQERARTVQGGLGDLPPDAAAAIREHSGRLKQQSYVESVQERLEEMRSEITHIGRQFRSPLRPVLPETEADSPQAAILQRIDAAVSAVTQEVEQAASELVNRIDSAFNGGVQALAEWSADYSRHTATLELAKTQQQQHAAALAQLGQLREEERVILAEQANLQKSLTAIPDGDAALPAAWTRWIGLHATRSAAIEEQCRELSSRSNGRLEVELRAGQDIDSALAVLESKLQGARIHANRWDALRFWLSEGGLAVQRWNILCNELLNLVNAGPNSGSAPVTPPALPCWDLTEAMRSGIRGVLSFESWLELATLTLQDVPVFYFTGGGTRLLFEQASAGQQATVLLSLLLKDADGPLLIDQPEDDLDNNVIADVIRDIVAAKQRRQLIFASHNANLVVNGDAELVVKFGTTNDDGKSRGFVEQQGAIDCQPVRDAITEVMEGGRIAFDLRRQKYGF